MSDIADLLAQSLTQMDELHRRRYLHMLRADPASRSQAAAVLLRLKNMRSGKDDNEQCD